MSRSQTDFCCPSHPTIEPLQIGTDRGCSVYRASARERPPAVRWSRCEHAVLERWRQVGDRHKSGVGGQSSLNANAVRPELLQASDGPEIIRVVNGELLRTTGTAGIRAHEGMSEAGLHAEFAVGIKGRYFARQGRALGTSSGSDRQCHTRAEAGD